MLITALLAAVWAAPGVLLADDGESLWSRIDFDLYGYVKLDAAYDDSPTAAGDFVKWVTPGTCEGNDDHFAGTVNQTRLGLRVSAPEAERFAAGARVEIDFYGGGDEPDPRIRHAYLTMSWPEKKLDLLIGQTSDVISPLNPSTLNYTVAWWAGNIGFRRPQLRLTKTFGDGPRVYRFEGALSHNIYDTKIGSVTGNDAGLASFQSRFSVTFPGREERSATAGLSAHWGQEDFDVGTGVEQRFDSWSVNADFRLPIRKSLTLKAELMTGACLAPYLGGIGHGADLEAHQPTHSWGGWWALDYAPEGSKLRTTFGMSLEDVDDSDLIVGERTSNGSIFGNAIYAFTRHFELGLELSHWQTGYKDASTADAFRLQTSFFVRF